MLFRAADLTAIFEGKRQVAFRRWKRPAAKAGGTVNTTMGLIAIDSVEMIDPAKLGDVDAVAAGFADLKALHKMFAASEGEHYRIRLRAVAPLPRDP